MEQLFASQSISVTDLKRSPTEAIQKAGSQALAVLHHNRPTAYLVPAATYQQMRAQLQMQLWRADAQASYADQRPTVSEDAVFTDIETAIQAATSTQVRAIA
jgi:antitoxin StbD